MALLGIERSHAAWLEPVHFGLASPSDIEPFIADLIWLSDELERVFPAARAFVRPGLDEPDEVAKLLAAEGGRSPIVLVYVTISSHNMTMKQIKIADLKARLSEHLRAVRNGETIAVLDRDTPVAHIVPLVRQSRALRVRKPSQGALPSTECRCPNPRVSKIDIVDVLLEERQGHR